MRNVTLIMMIILTAFLITSCGKKSDFNKQFEKPKKGDEIAVLTTNFGTIKVRFFEKDAPKAVENFKTHAKDGYYDGLTFHRVINDFMIQGGDPTGTGAGGESIWGKPFEDEIVDDLTHYRGALAMANSGPDTNGSQFFIVQGMKPENEELTKMIDSLKEINKQIDEKADNEVKKYMIPQDVLDDFAQYGGTIALDYRFRKLYQQPGVYTVFGQVLEGMDIVDKIATVETGKNDKPKEDVIMEKIEIVPYEE